MSQMAGGRLSFMGAFLGWIIHTSGSVGDWSYMRMWQCLCGMTDPCLDRERGWLSSFLTCRAPDSIINP